MSTSSIEVSRRWNALLAQSAALEAVPAEQRTMMHHKALQRIERKKDDLLTSVIRSDPSLTLDVLDLFRPMAVVVSTLTPIREVEEEKENR